MAKSKTIFRLAQTQKSLGQIQEDMARIITYPPEFLPISDEDDDAEVIVIEYGIPFQ